MALKTCHVTGLAHEHCKEVCMDEVDGTILSIQPKYAQVFYTPTQRKTVGLEMKLYLKTIFPKARGESVRKV